MRKLLPTPPRIGEQTQHKHQALRKGKSPQSLPSRLANYGGLGEPESSKHFCAEITVFASLCSVIFGKRGPASDCLTFFSYLARFLFENAEMPHFRAAFLLCIFFINTIWSEWGDSNSRHLAPKASALPTALHPVIKFSNCGQTCGQRRFLTNGFAELVPASGSVPAGCGLRLFPSWMGGICSQSRRATNCATPGYEVVGWPGRILPKQARYQLRYTRLWNCLSVVLHVVMAIF